jgi:hypothetical protein
MPPDREEAKHEDKRRYRPKGEAPPIAAPIRQAHPSLHIARAAIATK